MGSLSVSTFSVLQNQDAWWGEGNDMFQIDGDAPTIVGTGGEDYFLDHGHLEGRRTSCCTGRL